MNGFEKVGMILIGSYVAFNEWRIRNFVSKDRFGDLKERLIRIEDKIDNSTIKAKKPNA